MIDKAPKIETVTFDAGVVANRLQLLAQIKPLAWESYLIRRKVGQEAALNIDFSKPVPFTQLSVLNSIFDINAATFFTVSDEELQTNSEVFLRPEEN